MRYLILLSLALLTLPLRAPSQVTTAQRISDSLLQFRDGSANIWVDTARADVGIFNTIIALDTAKVFDTVIVLDVFRGGTKAAFFNATPVNQCPVTTATVPNSVTETAAYQAYIQSLQNCLGAGNYNLTGVSP